MLDVPLSKASLPQQANASRAWYVHMALGLMIISLSVAAMFLSRLPAADFAELSAFWPITGMAIALLRHHPVHLLWLSISLIIWSWLSHNALLTTLLLPLTLIGPLLYIFISQRTSSRFYRSVQSPLRVNDYVPITLFALVPSSLIGTSLYSASLPQFNFIDTLFVYGLAEFLGVLLFLPLTESFFLLLKQHSKPRFSALLLTMMLAFIPVLLKWLDYPAYAAAFDILLFPLFAIMICRYDRQSLIFSSFLLALIISISAGFGASQLDANQQIESFLRVNFWLIAFLLAIQILHQTFSEKMTLLQRSKFQATHNERTNIPNKRELETVFNTQTFGFLNMVQVKDRDTLNQRYASHDVEKIEKAIAQQLQMQLPQCHVFHISEMRFAVLSNHQINALLKDLQVIHIQLQEAPIYLNLCWGIVHTEHDLDKTLSYASAALNIAMMQPLQRIFGPGEREAMEAQLAKSDQYQEIMTALDNNGLILFQQSILDLEHNHISCAEVLSRLEINHQILSPVHFLDILKSFDSLSHFDRLVITQTLTTFMHNPLPHLQRININITGATLSDESFIPWLKDSIERLGLPPLRICFEITESDWIRHWDTATANAQALSDMGFLIAIDDFGAGLASFEYLDRFPMADIVKLDGAFVRGLATSSQQKAFVDATIIIAQSRGLDVCAEFVDCQETQDYLSYKGVKYAQGYFIAEPQRLD